jgi:hypothetical protein
MAYALGIQTAYALGIQTLGSGLRAWYSNSGEWLTRLVFSHSIFTTRARAGCVRHALAVSLAVPLAVTLAVTLAQIDPKGTENTRVGIHTRDVG